MVVDISANVAAHLQKRQRIVELNTASAEAAQQLLQVSIEALQDSVSTIALDSGATMGDEFESFSLGKVGDQNKLTLVKKLKVTPAVAG